jgi:hypothetical protein
VWKARRRLQQLEEEVARARAERAELQQRLAAFEMIAAAAGTSMPDVAASSPGSVQPGSVQPGPVQPGSVPVAPVPPALVAAAGRGRQQGSPVRLAVSGQDVIAVIGDEGGDPREWWQAIRRVTGRRDAS